MSSPKLLVATAFLSLILLSVFSSYVPEGSNGSQDVIDVFEIIEIPLRFDRPEMIQTDHGIEIHIQGVDQDPRSSVYSIPRLPISLDLPVNSRVLSVMISDPVMETYPLEGVLAMNPAPIPSADMSLFQNIPENIPATEDHIEFEIGTGLDLESMENVLKLPIFVYPSIQVEGKIRSLSSGTLQVKYQLPEDPVMDGPVEYDLLVICPDTFKTQMDEYALFRNLTGLNTVVVTLSDIANDVYWNISDNDTQEEMKRFIYNARLEWSIDYVLLAGDSNVMPVREIMVLDGYDDNGNSDGRFLPSDLYFADLFEDGTTDFCTWNEYRTDYHYLLWGEYSGSNLDDLDLYPDVSIGRIPAGSTTELTLMLDKITNYELSAMGSAWFMNATVAGTDTFSAASHGETSGVHEGEYMSDLISSGALSEFDSTKHYESLSNLSGIYSTVDKGCGFFEMSDHGNYDGWGYTPGGTAVRSSSVLGLDNGYKLPVVVLDACLTHGFDNENASNGNDGLDPVSGYSYYPPGPAAANRDCLGEAFHKAQNGGGIVTFGCTRVGYGYWGTAYSTRNSGYMNLHLHEAYADGFDHPGDMLTKAVEDYMNNIGAAGYASFKTVTEYVLLGDPSLTIGGVNGANIAVASDTMEVDILPNQTVEIEFNMTNTGLLTSLMNIEPVILEGSNWVASVTPDNGSIDPDQTINGTLMVTAHAGAIMGSSQTVTIKVDSPIMSESRTLNIIFNVGRIWEVAVEPDPPSTSIYQRGRVAGYLNISNLGNGPEVLNMTFLDLPEDWNLTLPSPTLSIAPFDEERVPFQIDLPDRTVAGSYDLEINVSSTLDPAFARSTFSVEVKKEFGLEIETDIERIDVLPGTHGTFGVTIWNLGNSRVTVDLGWDRTDLPGWELLMESEEITIDPFSNSVIEISAGIPGITPPKTYRIFVNATDGVVTRSTSVVINVSKVYSYQAICDVASKIQNGTGSTYFDIEILNNGNIFDLYSISRADDANANWTFSTSVKELSVDSQSTRSVRVSFSKPFPHQGNYTFSVQIEPYSHAPMTLVDLTVNVPPIFNFTIDGEMTDESSMSGEEMSGVVHISSLSNCDDHYVVDILPTTGFEVELNSSEVKVGPGGDMEIEFTVTPSPDLLAGQYPVEIIVVSNGSGKVLSRFLTVRIEEVYDISVRMVDPIIDDLVPEKEHKFEIEVTNNGNTRDSIQIKWNSSDYISSWIWLDGDTSSGISPGETRRITLIVQIPAWNITGGDYNLSISVTSFGETATTGNISLTIEGSKDPTLADRIDWPVMSMAPGMAFIILIIAIILGVMFIRKRSGEDLEDLGMEWESDEDEIDDEEMEWDDDE